MNIALVGMMGSGKTTIAKILANKLFGFSLVDMDTIISEQENCSINDIFTKKGENEFRKIESKLLIEILKSDNQIISTGGGIVLNEKNIENLKKYSIVFYLKADSNVLFERIKNNKDRPLLNSGDMSKKISDILYLRETLYEKAHYIINTNNRDIEEIANEIIRKFDIDDNS